MKTTNNKGKDPMEFMSAERVHGMLKDIIFIHIKDMPEDVVAMVQEKDGTKVPIVFKSEEDLKFYMSFFDDKENDMADIKHSAISFFNDGAYLLRKEGEQN